MNMCAFLGTRKEYDTIMEIYYILIPILFFFIFIKFNRNKIKGKLGEKRVSRKLKSIKGAYVINDLTFTVHNGKTCQIDHILVCNKGLFVIETKTYAGRIYGDDSRNEWTQVLQYGKVKNKFYSPVKQNMTHIFELAKKLNKTNFYNCVVFVNNNVSYIKSEYTFSLSKIKAYILSQKDVYTDEEVINYKNKIEELRENISNKQHVKNINNMKENIKNNICPRCGFELVLRDGKDGKFYGCSNFPKCKFTKKY